MSTAAWATRNIPPAHTSDLARFLAEVFRGQEHGFVHLGYIAGDPAADRTIDANKLKYAGWQKARDDAAIQQLGRELATTHGDSYIRGTAFAHRNYDEAHALPSAVVFVDDPKQHREHLSMVVQTSAASVQGYFSLDRCYPQTVIRALQELAKNVMDGDNCQSIGHFVRLPGGYNTKNGARFPVRLATLTSKRYTVDELRALLQSWQPAVTHATGPRSASSTQKPSGYSWTLADVRTFEQKQSDLLEYYGEHLAAMLSTTDGVQHPKSFNAHATHQGYKVCAGTLKIMNDAGTDLDYSDIRAAFIKSCVYARYDDAAIYLLTLHFCQYRDTLHVAQIDTVRYLNTVRGQLPHITPWPRTFRTVDTQARTITPIEPPPPAAKRPRGRPVAHDLDLDRFYAALVERMQHDADGEPIVTMTQQELADDLHICRRKVGTLEAGLRTAGRVSERTRSKRSYLPIMLDSTYATNQNHHTQQIKNDADEQHAVCSIPTPQTEQRADCALKGTYAAPPPYPEPDPAGGSGGYVPCDAAASPAAALSLGEMVREALDANGAGLVGRHMPTRVKQTARYIVDNFDGRTVDPARLARCIKAEQERRKYAAEAEHLETLDGHELQRALRSAERGQARAHELNRPRQAGMYGHKLQAIRAEYARRGLDPAVRLSRMKRAIPAKLVQSLPLLDVSTIVENCPVGQIDPPPPPNPAPQASAVLAEMAQGVPNVLTVQPSLPSVPTVPVVRPMNWYLLQRHAAERGRQSGAA